MSTLLTNNALYCSFALFVSSLYCSFSGCIIRWQRSFFIRKGLAQSWRKVGANLRNFGRVLPMTTASEYDKIELSKGKGTFRKQKILSPTHSKKKVHSSEWVWRNLFYKGGVICEKKYQSGRRAILPLRKRRSIPVSESTNYAKWPTARIAHSFCGLAQNAW